MRLSWRNAFAALTVVASLPIVAFVAGAWIASSLGCRIDEGSVHPCVLHGHDVGGTLLAMTLIGGLASFFTAPVVIFTSVMWIVLWRRGRRAARAAT